MKSLGELSIHTDGIGNIVGGLSEQVLSFQNVSQFKFDKLKSTLTKNINRAIIEAKRYSTGMVNVSFYKNMSTKDLEKRLDQKISQAKQFDQPLVFQSSILPVLSNPKLLDKLVTSGVDYSSTYPSDSMKSIIEAMHSQITEFSIQNIGGFQTIKTNEHALNIHDAFLATKEELIKKSIKPSTRNMVPALDENKVPPYPGGNAKNWNFNMVNRHEKRAKELGLPDTSIEMKDHTEVIHNTYQSLEKDLLEKNIRPTAETMASVLNDKEVPPYPDQNTEQWDKKMVQKYRTRAKDLGLIETKGKVKDHTEDIHEAYLATRDELIKKNIKPTSQNMVEALNDNKVPPYPEKKADQWHFRMVLKHRAKAKELGLL